MTFSQSIQTCFSKYADFTGRASRSEYWYFALFNFIIGCIFYALMYGFGDDGEPSMFFYILYGLYCLGVLLPSLAVNVRRLHDIGKGGGWIFISFVPLIGGIWYLVLVCLPSQIGTNRFGPVPGSNGPVPDSF